MTSAATTIEWTDEMREIARRASEGENLFITGRAGTGKSTLLELMRKQVLPSSTLVIAPTGVAARNVSGMTIHRGMHLPINVTKEMVQSRDWGRSGMYDGIDCIVIDEISMVRADLLDILDTALRRYGPVRGAAFGGVQLIAIGDPRQLPPVVRDDERLFIEQNYDSAYFFDAHVLEELPLRAVELTHNFRQSNENFYEALNAVRDGRLVESHLRRLNSRVGQRVGSHRDPVIRMVPTRHLAQSVNARELARLETDRCRARASVIGYVPYDERPTSDLLTYKRGAQVMMVSNDPEHRWVNGSMGMIVDCAGDDAKTGPCASVLLAGQEHPVVVRPVIWAVYERRSVGGRLEYKEIGSFEQLPFQLAWAITIHKSQGKTFDRAVVDFSSRPFLPGQTYVGLSRCKRLSGLSLTTPLIAGDAMIDPVVTTFLDSLAPSI